jgi:putative ABC transport system substrate-binding protein
VENCSGSKVQKRPAEKWELHEVSPALDIGRPRWRVRQQIAELAASARLPAIYFNGMQAKDGGLMSYGPDLNENYCRAATYVDKILKGATPADLSIEPPTKIQLVINLKTARALGLGIPPQLLARADEVIE